MAKEQKQNLAPAVILLGTQLGENIGTSARAMHNFGLTDLRLVAPREGWSRTKAQAAATSGAEILERAQMFDNLPQALEGLDYVIAATARPRDMNKNVLLPEVAATALRAHKKAGILFGAEQSGLDNEAISLCDAIVEIPANPEFSSLNLAQAVLLVAYQWFRLGESPAPAPKDAETIPAEAAPAEAAPKEDLYNLFNHLETELDAVGFFRSAPKRPSMVRNLRNIFHRAHLTSAEIKALRGVITSLIDERGRRK